MKTGILIILVWGSISVATAQEFKKFKVAIDLGLAKPAGNGASTGFAIALEPAYRVSDALAIGLRVESAIMGRGYSESVDEAELSVSGNGSYTLNGQYYFSNNTFRPFIGAGFGLYSLASVTVSVNGTDVGDAVTSESKFGFYPRLGFDLGHFNFLIDYNLLSSSPVEGGGDIKNSYLGIKLGAFFGGGRTK